MVPQIQNSPILLIENEVGLPYKLHLNSFIYSGPNIKKKQQMNIVLFKLGHLLMKRMPMKRVECVCDFKCVCLCIILSYVTTNIWWTSILLNVSLRAYFSFAMKFAKYIFNDRFHRLCPFYTIFEKHHISFKYAQNNM